MKQNRTRLLVAAALISGFSLSACTFDSPTHLNMAGRVEVQRDNYMLRDYADAISADTLQQVSRHYWGHGDGPLHVSAVYDPESSRATLAKAREAAGRIADGLRAQGVKDVRPDVLPVRQSGDRVQVMVSYAMMTADAPADCTTVISRGFADIRAGEDYKMGCSIDSYTARQIARPRDLLGNDVMDNNDGRRSHNLVEPYQTGVQNPPLRGRTASD